MARLATGRWARSLTGGPLSPGLCSTGHTVVDGRELFSWLSGAVFLRMAHLETAKEVVEYSYGANFRWSFRNCRCVGHFGARRFGRREFSGTDFALVSCCGSCDRLLRLALLSGCHLSLGRAVSDCPSTGGRILSNWAAATVP